MYATLSDVTALTGRAADGSSRPTADEIGGFIRSTAAVIDGYLAAEKYVVPVPPSATVAFELVRHYNALGARCLALQAAPTGKKDSDDDACKAWAAAQKSLADGKVQFPDLPRDTARSRTRAGSPTSRFPDDRAS